MARHGFTKPSHSDYTDKKENTIFLMYKEILNGSGAKSYMRKGFQIYEEVHKYLVILYMRRPLVIHI